MQHTASRFSDAAIAEYAERLLAYHQPHDMTDLVQKLGGTIAYHTDVFDTRMLDVSKPRQFTIWIPTLQGNRRDAFSIAQSIGYYMLHYLEPGVETCMHYFRPGHHDSIVQSNIFALSLLAPQDKFMESYKKHDGNLMRVVEDFPISDKAALHRAKTLGIYDASKDPFYRAIIG